MKKMPRLLSGPVGRPRSRQDFLQFCFVGRKLSLQISFQRPLGGRCKILRKKNSIM